MNDDDVRAAVLAADDRRREMLRAQDYAGLRHLLHPDLIHVHTRGNQDTRDSYLKYIAEVIEILNVERRDTTVKIYGNCAIMSGVQITTARARKKDETVEVKTQTLLVWLRATDWQLLAFQATSLGPLPPPPPR